MFRQATLLNILVLLVISGMPNVASALTLALHASDGIVDKTDPQNGSGDLATANAVIGENFNELGEVRGFVVFDTTGIDVANIDNATITLEILGGQFFFGTGVAELDVTLLAPLASYTDGSPPLSLYGDSGTLVATVDTSPGPGTYSTVDFSTALKTLDLSTNKIVVFRLETTSAITWPITQNNAIVVHPSGATALNYTLATPVCDDCVGYQDGFSQSIYMGHSFFNPGTFDIEVLAPYTGYNRHTQYKQIAGGVNGAPGALWRDTGEDELAKAEIKKGNVEIFGMTWHSVDSEFEDYATWIDFVLQYNADTFDTFFIQTVWPGQASYPTYAENRATQDLINAGINNITQQLRNAYPQLTILTVPVGEAMSRLWLLFDQGQLGPEILGIKLDGNRENYLQFDDTGHAGNIMQDIMGLIWLQTLYPETDVRTLSNPPTYQFNWTYDIRQLAYDIVQDEQYAHRYLENNTNVPTVGALGLALTAGLLVLGGMTMMRRT